MSRIAGQDLPDHKKVPYALRYIFGVGPKIADDVVKKARINPDKRANELSSEEVTKIQAALDQIMIEGDLRREINDNISRLKRIHAYRGLRHMAGLPVRGQRTRSNARTKRGAKKTIGALSKEAATKVEETKSTK
ncbi:MAG: 30S ribosomal protein S13 [Candidatus Pacebacteria bacterium GW2011_GWF2_38_9]|nr:MAG: 30S ribosomal protein S13, small subunit ribosomal protein S13 [candidate division TM6 bacterium GW2011_GWF2_28_16]KKQ08261.1 MAG: 30S ribosomal protein S13 [Candidatus Pacebacteria bacterium GW2011_GWF1_36_5]KKQ88579.1 MAG: 30S ribosomal protein S13 [Candidatus Pacebacteria bacterium GW2011_GWF2_38_9]HAZ73513.1 30S ribosomal protein S13 [Candidatus Paceibacterota bacterium]